MRKALVFKVLRTFFPYTPVPTIRKEFRPEKGKKKSHFAEAIEAHTVWASIASKGYALEKRNSALIGFIFSGPKSVPFLQKKNKKKVNRERHLRRFFFFIFFLTEKKNKMSLRARF